MPVKVVGLRSVLPASHPTGELVHENSSNPLLRLMHHPHESPRYFEASPGAGRNAVSVDDRASREDSLRPKILVVDDNQDAARMLSMMLKVLGNEVATAFDGIEAIERAAQFQPAVILMDLGMPRMNGYEAAKRIREAPGGSDILLVALTGWSQEEDKQRTEEAGFDHHLVKPVEPQALQSLLSQVKQRP